MKLNVYDSLFKKISLIYGILFALSLILITTIIISLNYKLQKNTLMSLSNEIVAARSSEIGEWLNSKISQIKIIAARNAFKNPDKEFIKNDLVNQHKFLDKDCEAMGFYDLNGDFFSSLGIGGNAGDRDYFTEIVNNKKNYFISNPLISRVTNNKIFVISHKVTNDNNELIGLVSLTVKFENLTNIISRIKIGKYGEAWITDNTGLAIAHPNEQIVNKLNLLKSKESGYKGLDEAGAEMVAGKSGSRYFFRNDGSKVFLIYSPIQNSNGWSMAVSLAEKDLLKDIFSLLRISIVIIIVLLLLVMLASFIIAGTIVNPIKLITQGANLLSTGDINLTGINQNRLIKINKRQDELGKICSAFFKLIDYQKNKISAAKEISSKNLNLEITVASQNDELGTAFSETINALNNALSQVNTAIQQLAGGASQVADASQSLSQGATEQASSLEEITSSITEINSQAKQNAENANLANLLAKKSMDNSELGNKQMKELVTAMNNITKSAEEIKKIVKVIDDIAFQTNLLALNANVEAARAGKYGKGFAVVAEEVRNLAGRSAESVKETTAMVEEAVKNIMNGNNLVDVTAKQLDEITQNAGKVADLVEEIATASKEQTQGLEQINQGLGQIDQVTQSNTANAEESASAAEELSGQAEQLKTIITQFKLSEKYSTNQIIDFSQEKSIHLKKIQELSLKKDKNIIFEKIKNIKDNKTINPKHIIKLDDDNFGKF